MKTEFLKIYKTFLNKFVYSSIFGRFFVPKKGLNDIQRSRRSWKFAFKMSESNHKYAIILQLLRVRKFVNPSLVIVIFYHALHKIT